MGGGPGDEVKIQFARRAVREIERAAHWWRNNRLDAPDLFEQELAETLEKIRRSPTSPKQVRASHGKVTYRVLMRETHYHVYYRVEQPDVVRVQAVWGAKRGREPKL